MRDHPAIKSSRHKTQLIWVLLLLGPISGMTVDLIAPSLPGIARSLNISQSMAKNVITTYLLGYSLGSFIAGFLTDAYGRKNLLRVSIFGFVLASLLPVFFPNEQIVLIARALQGVFIAGQSAVCRATMADILTASELNNMGTMLGTMWGLGPVIGPVLGGYFQHYLGWQAGFVFFAVMSFILFVAVMIVMPETHLNPKPLRLKTAKSDMRDILRSRAFMGLVIIMGLTYSLLIIFNTLGPFLIQKSLGFSATYYGHFALVLGCVFLVSTMVCRRLLKQYSVTRLIHIGLYVFLALTLVALVFAYFSPMNIYFIGLASSIIFFMTGFVFPMAMGLGIGMFRHTAGTASSVMFLFNVLITTLVALISSFYHIDSAIPLIWAYIIVQIAIVIIYWLTVHGRLEGNG